MPWTVTIGGNAFRPPIKLWLWVRARRLAQPSTQLATLMQKTCWTNLSLHCYWRLCGQRRKRPVLSKFPCRPRTRDSAAICAPDFDAFEVGTARWRATWHGRVFRRAQRLSRHCFPKARDRQYLEMVSSRKDAIRLAETEKYPHVTFFLVVRRNALPRRGAFMPPSPKSPPMTYSRKCRLQTLAQSSSKRSTRGVT